MKISVKVIPCSKRERILESDEKIRVYVSCSPDKGKANSRVVELIAGRFNVPKSSVKIIRGRTSRDKIMEVCLKNG